MSEFLSIIIPAYNEASRIAESLAEVLEFARSYPGQSEIIVVDDGSTDATPMLVACAQHSSNGERMTTIRTTSLKFIQHPRNRGKGAAVRTGFNQAVGDIVLFTDVDLSTPLVEIPRLLQPIIDDRCDVAIGSRALAQSVIEYQQGVIRRNAGRAFNRMVRAIVGLDLHDTQCGFKAFRRSAMVPAFAVQRIDGFAFDVELLYLASKLGLRILELPVRWAHAHGSKVSLFHHTQEMAVDLCRICWNDYRGLYKIRQAIKGDSKAVPCSTH